MSKQPIFQFRDLVGFLFLLVTGCTQQSVHLQPELSEQTYAHIARDAVKQLRALYPPAKTRWVIDGAQPSAFHRVLLQQLRQSGYAIQEQSETQSVPLQGQHLTIIWDALTNLAFYGSYRLTLTIDKAELSRLVDSNHIDSPVYWSYRP